MSTAIGHSPKKTAARVSHSSRLLSGPHGAVATQANRWPSRLPGEHSFSHGPEQVALHPDNDGESAIGSLPDVSQTFNFEPTPAPPGSGEQQRQAEGPTSSTTPAAPVASPEGGAAGAGGGAPATSSGGSGGDGAPTGGGGSPVSSGGGATDPGPGVSAVPSPELSGNDQKLAQAIEAQLKGTPLGGQGLGAHFVAAGRQNDVDPLALVAISRLETNFGRLGVGIRKHMGVGAYENNPNGRTPFDGAVQQIYSGAKTFARLRAKGGSNSKAPMAEQLAAVDRGGWAVPGQWHGPVTRAYNDIVRKANATVGAA